MLSCSSVDGIMIGNNHKWCSYINVDGNHIKLGRHHDKEEAIQQRKEAELQYFGEVIAR